MVLLGLKTLDDVVLKNKRILIRVDINADVESGKVIPSRRFQVIIQTIKEAQRNDARIVLIAHQGRSGSSDFTSLKQHAKILSKYIKVKFVPDTIGKRAVQAIKSLKPRQVLLLENLRFLKEETEPTDHSILVSKLAPLFDIYINDAFSASHRMHTSVVEFPRRLESAIGRAFEQELRNCQKLQVKGLFIMGGVKPEDYLELLEKTRTRILATGYFGALCLIAAGYNLGKENKILKTKLNLIPRIKKLLNRIVLPVDVAVQSKNGKRQDILVQNLPSRYPIYDCGKKTISLYEQEISKAKSILIKGLPGLCHTKAFCEGSKRILKAIAKSNAHTIIGGGHTENALDRFHINRKKISYISLSGGALMQYLSQKPLPGIEAIKNSNR